MKSCVCILAWHTNPGLYETLVGIPGLDLYILSHRRELELPTDLQAQLNGHILFEPNLGYDWGGYQQFLEKEIYKQYSVIFFAHDDIVILDNDIFNACVELIDSTRGNCIVGNSRQSNKRDWPLTHIHSYAHSKWKPPSWDFCHDVVRGSFFATSSAALTSLGRFEILWDRHGFFGVGAGNWSLRATCGKFQYYLGEDAFRYLNDTDQASPYLIELYRGQSKKKPHHVSIIWRMRYKLMVELSRLLMVNYMNANSISRKKRLDTLMEKIFAYL